MGKHNKATEMDDLLAQVDADAKPRVKGFGNDLWEIEEFIYRYTDYLRDTFNSAYGTGSQIHIEDAASHAYAAAENLFHSVTNFRK